LKKSKHAVETKNLSISWGKVNVLNQINFELNEGEKLAIVGPSGSGKS
jgi:phospholipid/cholesterol/gamma-HCH transport system ATP-binding protein